MKEDRNAFKILRGNPTGKRPIGRWEDNIRMYPKEICINKGHWVDFTQDRDYWIALVNAVLKPWVS